MSDKTYLAMLAKAFTDFHGCEAKHVETVPVIERLEGKTVWRGEVEVFDLIDHPDTRRGYAWTYDEKSGSEPVAVLELPPVSSPLTAVHAARIGLAKSKKGQTLVEYALILAFISVVAISVLTRIFHLRTKKHRRLAL